jgi:fructose-bisphosphate aldolase class II
MKQVCAERYQQFWTAGNASKIKQMTLDDYAAKYAKGELSATAKQTVSV